MVLVAMANSPRHIVNDGVIETSFNTSWPWKHRQAIWLAPLSLRNIKKQAANIALLHAPVTWVAIEPGILLDLLSRSQPV
jgi:hypothetical protein